MMKSKRLKLLGKLGLLICLSAFKAYAQYDSSKSISPSGFGVIIGYSFSPFGANYNFSAASTLSLQIGDKQNNSFFSIKGGLYNFEKELISDHETNYAVNGYFIQPGFCYYTQTPFEAKYTPYFGFSVFYSASKHEADILINDPNWGTKKVYTYVNEINYGGLVFDYGFLFKIKDNLKAHGGASLSLISQPLPFKNEIKNYNPGIFYTPGTGFGRLIALNFNFGIYYTL